MGGINDDYGYSVMLGGSNDIYVTGQTNSGDFPTTPGAFDRTNTGYDVYVAKLDIMPPTTSLETSPTVPDGDAGWFKTRPRVDLSRDEAGVTYFQLDTTDPASWVAGDTTTMPEGAAVVYYYSRDTAGNTETVRGTAIQVDTGPPTDPILASSTHVPGLASSLNQVLIEIAGATDAVSGVEGLSLSWTKDATGLPAALVNFSGADGTTTSPVLADGSWYLNARTKDRAGNWTATAHSGPYVIDTQAPGSVLGLSPVLPNGDSGWFVTTPTISIGRNEPGTTFFQYDSTASLGWTGSAGAAVSVAALSGGHRLYFFAEDLAGNTEPIDFDDINIDTRPPETPVLTGVAGGPREARLWWTESSDTASGTALYRISDSYTGTLLAETSGTSATLTGLIGGLRYKLHVRAVDGAGNQSQRSANVFIVVSGGPLPGTGVNLAFLAMLAALVLSMGAFIFFRATALRRRRAGLSL